MVLIVWKKKFEGLDLFCPCIYIHDIIVKIVDENNEEFPKYKWEGVIKTVLIFGIASLETTESILAVEENLKNSSNDMECLTQKDFKRRHRKSFTYSDISEIYQAHNICTSKLHKPKLVLNEHNNLKSGELVSTSNNKTKLEKKMQERCLIERNSSLKPQIITNVFNNIDSIFRTEDILYSRRKYKKINNKYSIQNKKIVGGNTRKDKKQELSRLRNLTQRSLSAYGVL